MIIPVLDVHYVHAGAIFGFCILRVAFLCNFLEIRIGAAKSCFGRGNQNTATAFMLFPLSR